MLNAIWWDCYETVQTNLNQFVKSGSATHVAFRSVSCKGQPWLRDCPHLSTSVVYPRQLLKPADPEVGWSQFKATQIPVKYFGALRLLYESFLTIVFYFMMQPLQLRWIKSCQTMHDVHARFFLWKDVYGRFFQVLEQSHTIKTKHNTPSNAKSTSWGR